MVSFRAAFLRVLCILIIGLVLVALLLDVAVFNFFRSQALTAATNFTGTNATFVRTQASLHSPTAPAPATTAGWGHAEREKARQAFDAAHMRFKGAAKASFRLPLSDTDITVVNGVATHAWWSRVASGAWEPQTFRVFNQELRPGMVYVGFGEWVGVTGLFAAQRVKKAILMDADPRAYEELRANVKLNQASLSNRMETDPRCISSSRGKVKMHGNGGSGSSIVSQAWTTGMPEFEVDCLPLSELLAEYGVTTETDHVFVKIDTEGAESLILPSLREWVEASKKKPTIFLSMHNKANPDQRKAIVAVLNLFPFYAVLPGRTSDVDLGPEADKGECKAGVALHPNPHGNRFLESALCSWCDYLVTTDATRANVVCPAEQKAGYRSGNVSALPVKLNVALMPNV